jgi:predicted Zn finger-like uncharacterized protein
MILKCSQCQMQYKLDPAMLGAGGREVRCVNCGHQWFQAPEKMEEVPPAEALTKKLDEIIEQDDAAFEAILSSVSNAAKPAGAGQTAPAESPAEPREKKKAAMPQEPRMLPPITYNPFGVGARAFGVLVFCLCVFLSLAVIFVAQKPILRHWPQMALLYETIGFTVTAPGEGLRISEMTAEQRADGKGKALVVEGKMTNTTRHDLAYPALQVILKSGMDKVLKTWDLKPGAEKISSGSEVPMSMKLTDAPEGGATLEVRLKGE